MIPEPQLAVPPFLSESNRRPAETLGSKAASGVGWSFAGVLVRSCASFCINIILARLLGPKPFGLVALSMIVITLGNLLVDSGLSVQLIRGPVPSSKLIRGVFTLQCLVGLILASGIMLTTPVITGWLNQPDAAHVIRVLAIMLVVTSAGQPSAALLRRDLRFKAIQKVQILSYLAGYGALGLPLALQGAGVWALVWAQLAQAIFSTILSWALVRHSVVPWVGAESRHMLRFGSFLAGSNVACWCIGAMPSFLIGRTLGAGALGFYNRASNLAGLPASTLIPPVQTVALSLFSRLQGDPAAVRKTVLAVISTSAFTVFPLSLLIAGSAVPVVQLVLGQAWIGAVPAFAPLACAMCVDAVASICSTFLISCGRPDLDLRAHSIAAVVGICALCVAAFCGASVATLAWTVCACVYALRALMAARFMARVADISWLQLGSALRSGAFIGAIVFSAARLISLSLGTSPALIRLASSCAGAIGAAFMLVLLIPRILLYSDLLWTIRRSGVPIPLAVEAWLDRAQAPAGRLGVLTEDLR